MTRNEYNDLRHYTAEFRRHLPTMSTLFALDTSASADYKRRMTHLLQGYAMYPITVRRGYDKALCGWNPDREYIIFEMMTYPTWLDVFDA